MWGGTTGESAAAKRPHLISLDFRRDSHRIHRDTETGIAATCLSHHHITSPTTVRCELWLIVLTTRQVTGRIEMVSRRLASLRLGGDMLNFEGNGAILSRRLGVCPGCEALGLHRVYPYSEPRAWRLWPPCGRVWTIWRRMIHNVSSHFLCSSGTLVRGRGEFSKGRCRGWR